MTDDRTLPPQPSGNDPQMPLFELELSDGLIVVVNLDSAGVQEFRSVDDTRSGAADSLRGALAEDRERFRSLWVLALATWAADNAGQGSWWWICASRAAKQALDELSRFTSDDFGELRGLASSLDIAAAGALANLRRAANGSEAERFIRGPAMNLATALVQSSTSPIAQDLLAGFPLWQRPIADAGAVIRREIETIEMGRLAPELEYAAPMALAQAPVALQAKFKNQDVAVFEDPRLAAFGLIDPNDLNRYQLQPIGFVQEGAVEVGVLEINLALNNDLTAALANFRQAWIDAESNQERPAVARILGSNLTGSNWNFGAAFRSLKVDSSLCTKVRAGDEDSWLADAAKCGIDASIDAGRLVFKGLDVKIADEAVRALDAHALNVVQKLAELALAAWLPEQVDDVLDELFGKVAPSPPWLRPVCCEVAMIDREGEHRRAAFAMVEGPHAPGDLGGGGLDPSKPTSLVARVPLTDGILDHGLWFWATGPLEVDGEGARILTSLSATLEVGVRNPGQLSEGMKYLRKLVLSDKLDLQEAVEIARVGEDLAQDQLREALRREAPELRSLMSALRTLGMWRKFLGNAPALLT